MALHGRIPTRLLIFTRAINSERSKIANWSKVSFQIANLTTLPIDKPSTQPWPYKTRPYKYIHSFWESTSKRFDENSKVIAIDGNIAVGKSEFAERIAKVFNMKFFPDGKIEDTCMHRYEDGSTLDMRQFNERLPERLRFYDLDQFFRTDKDPKKHLQIGRTQLHMYQQRLHHYGEIISHVLNTGQGVVMERGAPSDVVFAEALAKLGYMTPQGLKFYRKIRKYSLCEFPRPHLIIYLDAPVNYVRDQINKRNVPYEVNSKVLTDEFIKTYDDVYKKKYLPEAKLYSKVLEVDVSQKIDWDLLLEELEMLNLEPENEDEDETMFSGWNMEEEEDWNGLRINMCNKNGIESLFHRDLPWDAPELMITGMDYDILLEQVLEDPKVEYEKGYQGENSFFKLL